MTLHSYSLAVCGRNPYFYCSPMWDNFCEYVRSKFPDAYEDIPKLRWIIDNELTNWNATNDHPTDTISFKTEEDRTIFILRFA